MPILARQVGMMASQDKREVAGWWPVGALVSRLLVQHHAADPDGVGVVTTFRQQVEATHAALRDAGQNLIVPVGTAHSFQGREFGAVVFDLVEDGRGWISAAKWHGDATKTTKATKATRTSATPGGAEAPAPAAGD